MAKILICDDERNLRELLSLALSSAGHEVVSAANGGQALKLLEREPCELLITDLKLPDISGIDLLRYSKRLAPGCPVILITAFASTETAVIAMKEGAFDYLEKPFRVEDLRLVVARSLEQSALLEENARLRQALEAQQVFGEIVGSSVEVRQVLDLARRVARTDATVLITGESGTGKELIARAIHRHSPRAERQFVAINCAAIPETLIESELFGHGKGAFSGAIASRKGVFVEADGGTLLLDELGEMPLSTQVKLLRVLQERMVRPVGTDGERAVDVRVIATTNRDLVAEVAERHFREDLFYRINVVNLTLPPLRKRRGDIPLLVAHYLEVYSKRHHLKVKRIVPEAMDCLMRYSFPGNVRELENMIEGAVSLTMGEELELAVLPERVRASGGEPGRGMVPAGPVLTVPPEGINLERELEEFESGLIRQALELVNGNKTRAAELLGLSFRSLRYRLAKLGIARDEEG